MFVWIGAPQQTHAITFDFPTYAEGRDSSPWPEPLPSAVRVTLNEAGSISIDGDPVSEAELAARLDLAAAQPFLQVIAFDPHPQASYLASARALAIISESMLGSELCFSGTHEYRTFTSHPAPFMLTRVPVDELAPESYRVPNRDLVGLACPWEALETVWLG
ncbi:hypothetical protein [Aurantiacibacter sp. D1-12]|uniref:hypothetical protein n=1 Tax=Aurantiacibacter sp. D1-12 TaxID=2993658 RepID=UPI00237CBB3A|nr:hypothetical protein [Aurantiacibacter sp. D1-12]MDE1468611.1 hypothetical protein [Aurantiacibacter sp. D1-12]